MLCGCPRAHLDADNHSGERLQSKNPCSLYVRCAGDHFNEDGYALLGQAPEGWALGLPGIYVAWVVVLAVMYGPCAWFARVKERHRGGWLSYF